MKKHLAILTLLIVGFSVLSFGQFQVNMSVTGNQLSFKLKPTSNTNATFSVIEFFVRYPSATAAFNYGTITENTTNFPGMTDFTVQSEAEASGFKYDHFIYTAPAPVTTAKDYMVGQEYEVFTVPFDGASVPAFEIVHSESFIPFYLAITNILGADIAPSDPANYFYPTTHIAGVAGERVFSQNLGDNTLPVKFLSFYALKSGDDAKLVWSVASDDENKYFDIERSTNGRGFTSFARVNAFENGKAINSYEATDNVISKNGSKELYYRIKQVDKSGITTYSVIRNLNVDQSSLGISLYPNPARSTSKLIVDAPEASKAILVLRDFTGKQLQVMNLQFVKGINQKDINVSSLPAGDYNVTVVSEKLNKSIKLTKLN